MYLNAIVFAKLQKLYGEVAGTDDRYFLTFAPIVTSFSNTEFNFLNPNASTGDEVRQNGLDKMAFAAIANAIIRDPKLFKLNNDERLQDAYGTILDGALLIDSTIPDSDKAAYAVAKSLLFATDALEPTDTYAKYQGLSAKYAAIEKQIFNVNAQLSEADGSAADDLTLQKQNLELKQKTIFNDWLISGEKDKVEAALKVITRVNQRGSLKNDFVNEQQNLRSTITSETTVNSNIKYLPTFCLPSKLYQYESGGWTKVGISSEEITRLETDARSFLGDSMYDTYASSSPTPVTKIEFEYLFVTVQRPWFNKDVIDSKFWKFPENDPTVVSDGANLGVGILPAFVDKFLFVRRITEYAAPDHPAATGEVHVLVPMTYKFRDIAALKDLSKVSEAKATEAPISRVRFARTAMMPPAAHTDAVDLRERDMTVMRSTVIDRTAIGARRRMVFGKVSPAVLAGWAVHVDQPASPPPPPPTPFAIELRFTDPLNNPIVSLDVSVTESTSGTDFSAETDNTGKILLSGMSPASYHVTVRESEVFEDFENTYQIDAAFSQAIVLQKREHPRFEMWMIGAVNFRFPTLPDPIEGATYE